jgi:signal transduction histidine kinase/ligand-binding sensor domain-containing protein
MLMIGTEARRGVVGRGILLACILLACSSSAFALNPALDVSQYAHTSWKIRDGFSKGLIRSITQTPDGYLWLGTEFGLLRFDGVRAVPWQPPSDQPLPSTDIWSVLASRDGTLWIGTSKGLASWKGGRLTPYPELSARIVGILFEDRDGVVWAAGLGVPNGRLCAIRVDTVRCDGDDGGFGYGVFEMYEDSERNLWASSGSGLWKWKPDPPTHFSFSDPADQVRGFAEDKGALLVTSRAGLQRLVRGKLEPYTLSGPAQHFSLGRMFRDRDGGLWIATAANGLVHLHEGAMDVFSQADGLSGNDVESFYEDREGNIWVATLNGLDRFRALAVTTFSGNQFFVLASRDGSIWMATADGLERWNHGQVIAYRERARPATPTHVREIVGSGLPERGLESIFQDVRGRIWVATQNGLGYLQNDRFVLLPDYPGRSTRVIAEDAQENLWITDQELGLFQVSVGQQVKRIPWTALGRKDFGTALIGDRVRGGIWVGFWDGGVSHFKDGRVDVAYGAAEGLGSERVNGFHIDPDGTVWVATAGGLSRLNNGRVTTLTSKSGLPCDGVHWVMDDDERAFWLNTPCGLLNIARGVLDDWVADPTKKIESRVFDSSDGVRSRAMLGGYSPQVTRSSDGNLWFCPDDGVSVVDPRRLPINTLAPPVHIERIIADRKQYDVSGSSGQVSLPPLIRDLQIDYTALSLVAPEKNRFRIKLEGRDREWQDVGNRRQTFYNDLPPGNYRFRVSASNNSGLWNEAGAFLDFSVAPAYYQTAWFRVSTAAGLLAVLAALYRIRLRQVANHFNMRLEERVNERTRIARDLHDTLLQSFHGVLLRFQAVAFLLPDRPADAQKALESGIDQAAQALVEGRDAVQGLRSSVVATRDLPSVVSALGEELAANRSGQSPADFRVQVEGIPRDLSPLVQDEVYRIAREALRNAFQHAHAARIEAEIRYDRRQFRLRVRDDGKGMDQKVADGGGRAGHYGLAGMRERAKLVRGALTIWSELNSGTEVELTIPGSMAYANSSDARPSTVS